MRERVLGDPAFLMKLGVEAGMGVITKLLAELHKRPVKFWTELDLVFANVVMSLLADVALIWIPAPRLSLTPQAHKDHKETVWQGAVSRWLAACPDNAFQVSMSPALPIVFILSVTTEKRKIARQLSLVCRFSKVNCCFVWQVLLHHNVSCCYCNAQYAVHQSLPACGDGRIHIRQQLLRC